MELAALSARERPERLVSRALWQRWQALETDWIVAVARKLLIALWRFLETGVVPEGAVLKEG